MTRKLMYGAIVLLSIGIIFAYKEKTKPAAKQVESWQRESADWTPAPVVPEEFKEPEPSPPLPLPEPKQQPKQQPRRLPPQQPPQACPP